MTIPLIQISLTDMFEFQRSDFLFTSGSLLMGAGSLLNVAGSYYMFNTSDSPEEADTIALASDWALVGQDLREAFDGMDSAEGEQ